MAMLAKRNRTSSAIPTSSMADIAFLLLVFFLVTTVFPKDRGLRLVLPEDAPPVDVPRANLLTLFVASVGSVDVLEGDADRTYTLAVDRLGDVWRDRSAERPGLIAAIRTSPEAPYGAMVDVLDALQGAGARRISLKMGAR